MILSLLFKITMRTITWFVVYNKDYHLINVVCNKDYHLVFVVYNNNDYHYL